MINTITTIMMIIIMISVASGRRIVETRLGNYPLVPLPPAATKSHLQSCHPCGCRHHHRSLSIRCRKKQTRMILMIIMRIISMTTIIMEMMKSKTMTILTWAGNEQIWCLRVHRHVKIPTLACYNTTVLLCYSASSSTTLLCYLSCCALLCPCMHQCTGACWDSPQWAPACRCSSVFLWILV